MVIRRDKVLRGFDEECRTFLMEQLQQRGVIFHKPTTINAIKKGNGDDGKVVHLADGSSIECDLVLCATGRKPKTANIGLEGVGVQMRDNGEVIVDEWQKTNIDSIYAIGDCTGTLQLTPVALAEGHALADTLYGGNVRQPDLENVATAVFCQPNLGTVGLTEAQAVQKYGRVKVFTSTYTPLKHRVSMNKGKEFMKVLVDEASDRVVGIHIIAHGAGDICQGFACAIKCGMTKAQMDSTIGIHPTAAEELVTMRTMKRIAEAQSTSSI